ncbi:hypothetical protein [Enterococcus olivae]
MIQLQELKVGERYEVQPKDFHRRFIGKVHELNGNSVLFKVENYDNCDQKRITADKLVEVDALDVKVPIRNTYFFS